MADHDDHDHPPQQTFVEHPFHASFFFVVLFAAYWLSLFEYVENDFSQLMTKASKGKGEVVWTSFDRVLSEKPKRWFQPSTKEEILEVVRQAAKERTTLKALMEPVGLTQGFIMNLDKYNKIINVDTASKQVRVQAGIRIRDLSEHLATHRLSLANTGVLDRQSLAGALSTGTHGTGIHFPLMSSMIVAMELITSDGRVLQLRKDDATNETMAEVFEAATISLGALGVISEMTLQCIDSFSIIKRSRAVPFADTLGDLQALDQLTHTHDHLMAWWVPYTSTVQLLEANRTTYGDTAVPQEDVATALKPLEMLRWPLKYFLGLLQMRLLSAAAHVSSLVDAKHVPLFNQWLIAPLFNGPCYLMGEGRVGVKEGYKGIMIPDHPDRYREMEYFLPKTGFEKAFPDFLSLLEEKREVAGANLVVQLRWTKRDDLWLSPFRIQEPYAVAIAILMKGFEVDSYFKGAEAIFVKHGGRPHWGKLHNLRYDDLAAAYGDRWRRFAELRGLLDPSDTFLNKHLKELLVPTNGLEHLPK